MKKITLTKLIAQKFTQSHDFANGRIRGLSCSSEGFTVEHITNTEVCIMKRSRWNNNLKRLEEDKRLMEIPTGSVRVDWQNRTMGFGDKPVNRISEISEWLNQNNVEHSIEKNAFGSDTIIVKGIDVSIPSSVREVIS